MSSLNGQQGTNVPSITREQWDSFKSQFPNDKRIQAVTFEELLSNTNGGTVDWQNPPTTQEIRAEVRAAGAISDCELWIGYVVYDAICLAIGAVGLRAGANRAAVEAVAEAARPVLPKLEAAIAKMAAQGATTTDLAWGVFEILKTIWSGGFLGAVVSVFLGTLTWYYWLLYGATGLATIVAALLTDGAAFVAEVTIELATFGFLVADSVNCAKACS